MPIVETSDISNEENYNPGLNNNLKNLSAEKSNLNNINSSACSITSIKLESSKINENTFNQVNNHLTNEKHSVVNVNCKKKTAASDISKDRKSKHGSSFTNKSTYNKHVKQHPLSKRKFVPVASTHLTNASAKVVLFERNVEIKDLESKVKYLQNKIKELENENKTLQCVQSRQGRELKKFKEGVADIPSLLRSHKEETKVYESALSSIRRELRDCQRDIKVKNEVMLKKDSHIDKLNITIKRYEKSIQDLSNELREFKVTKKDLEDENKTLFGANESLKSENENLQKKIKCMIQEIENLEENLMKEKIVHAQLKDDLVVAQKKFEDLQSKMSIKYDNIQSDQIRNCNLEKEESKETSKEILSEDNVKSENNKSCDFLSDERKEKSFEKGAEKTKDALIHTLKRYQDFCNTKHNPSATETYGIGASNLKMLPPLKQSRRRYSQNKQADFVSKESFSAAGDVCETKYWQSEHLAKYFHNKLKTNSSSKIESIMTKDDKNCQLKPNISQPFFEVSTFDNW